MIRLPLYERAIYAVPVVGWVLKDVAHGDPANKWWLLFILASVWVMAIMTFGYPAVILPALAAVPTMFVILLIITRG